jgi:hypothetical protein
VGTQRFRCKGCGSLSAVIGLIAGPLGPDDSRTIGAEHEHAPDCGALAELDGALLGAKTREDAKAAYMRWIEVVSDPTSQ